MKQKINNGNLLSALKEDDIIYNKKDRWSVYENRLGEKELELILIGADLQINLHLREHKGMMLPLKKSYNSIIEDHTWEVERNY